MAMQPICAMKTCTKCGVAYPANNDNFQGLGGKKLHARCRGCVSADRRRVYANAVIAPREAAREKLDVGLKRCKTCQEVKPLSKFYDAPECKLGVRPECASCTIAGQSKHYYARTEGRRRKRLTPYSDGDMRTCGRCGSAKPATLEHFGVHKSVLGLSSWCRPCKAEYHQIYLKPQTKCKIARRVAKANRNARMRGKSGFVTQKTLKFLHHVQNGVCFYCTAQLSLIGAEVDHFVPIAKGGAHATANLVLACPPCNRRKSATLPWVWMPDRFTEGAPPR